MKRALTMSAMAVLLSGGAGFFALAEEATKWAVHDETRPRPKVIQPGTESIADQPGKAPADALVLFDGKDLSHWSDDAGGAPTWKVESGYMEAAGGKNLVTKDAFGSCQLHVEWASPEKVEGTGQGRGNSGVYIMKNYEVQVLDSYENETYADGQAAALYGQFPPLVNASRGPGKWQTYDIVFHRPQFDASGKVTKPATITVLHNGVLVQDHTEFRGKTSHKSPGVYSAHADKLPILLQFHGNPVRFRNIWIRHLED